MPIQFAVLRFEGEWRVLTDGRDSGHFDYRVDAVERALRLAGEAQSRGQHPEVLVQDPSGQVDRLRMAAPDA